MTRASDTARLLGAGATILDGTTISTADNTTQLTLTSTDADSSVGPVLDLVRDSASPADGDGIGQIKFIADNDAGEATTYSSAFTTLRDASNGAEDGQTINYVMTGGALVDHLRMGRSAANGQSEVIINEGSADIDFRVESNGNANMLFVDGGNDAIIVSDSTSRTVNGAGSKLQISHTDYGCLSMVAYKAAADGAVLTLGHSRNATIGSNTILQDGDALGGITFVGADGSDLETQGARIDANVDGTPGANDMPTRLVFRTTADGASSTTERMRISNGGTAMIGRTAAGYSNTGAQFTASGAQNIFVADGDYALGLGRRNSNGTILEFRRDNSAIGRIAGTIGLVIGTADTGLGFETSSADAIIPQNPTTVAGRDDAIDLGNGSNRFDDIFATNTSITTSDRNEKQDIEELTDAEKRVAVVAKGLMRKYRWKSKVAEKGDKARTHFGIIAQDLQDAFTAESLDASKYAMFCSDTWWEKEITVDAVEAKDAVYEEVTDSSGNKENIIVSHAVEAKDAYTYRDIKQEATEGYTEKTRLGVRYSELLAFIISAI